MSFYVYQMNGYPFMPNIQYFPTFPYQYSTIHTNMNDCFDYMVPVQFASQADYRGNNDKINNIDKKQYEIQNVLTNKCLNIEYEVQIQQNVKNVQKKRIKKSIQKQISSAKKNSQSNIVNQFYSFFSCRQKSQKIVIKAIQTSILKIQNSQKIINLFYATIREINRKRGRKYVNRVMLKNYFTPQDMQNNLPEFMKQLNKVEFINLQELCQIFRRCCQAFFKIVSIPAILTSKRIIGISKQQHFKKRRKILKALTQF